MTDELKQWEYDKGYTNGRASLIEELEKIIEKIDFEEKWLFNLYAEHRLSTGDIDIAMGAIRSKVSEFKENKE